MIVVRIQLSAGKVIPFWRYIKQWNDASLNKVLLSWMRFLSCLFYNNNIWCSVRVCWYDEG
jgi:hypothetical protein